MEQQQGQQHPTLGFLEVLPAGSGPPPGCVFVPIKEGTRDMVSPMVLSSNPSSSSSSDLGYGGSNPSAISVSCPAGPLPPPPSMGQGMQQQHPHHHHHQLPGNGELLMVRHCPPTCDCREDFL